MKKPDLKKLKIIFRPRQPWLDNGRQGKTVLRASCNVCGWIIDDLIDRKKTITVGDVICKRCSGREPVPEFYPFKGCNCVQCRTARERIAREAVAPPA